jgi:hypothetical protein
MHKFLDSISSTTHTKKKRSLFLTVVETGKSKSRCQPSKFPVRDLFLLSGLPLSHYILQGGKITGNTSSFIEKPVLSDQSSTLTTSFNFKSPFLRPYFQSSNMG